MKRIHELEMIRFAQSPEGTLCWVKDSKYGWITTGVPVWSVDNHYIVDDVHAELRKLQIDKPETKFMLRAKGATEWSRPYSPSEFNLGYEYKVVDWTEDAIGKLCVFAGTEVDLNVDSGLTQKFAGMNDCLYRSASNQRWKYCRLLTKEDLDD